MERNRLGPDGQLVQSVGLGARTPSWGIVVLVAILCVLGGILMGCQGPQPMPIESIPVVEPEGEKPPFNPCKPIGGEKRSDRLRGHAFGSPLTGCI